MSDHTYRRPAMLNWEEAEAIVGDADPAGDAEVAHTSAWGLLGVPGEGFDAEHVWQLQESVRAQGVDIIAGLWDRSPHFTLPGALWRLYLLWQWHQLDPTVLAGRFAEGLDVLTQQGSPRPQSLEATIAEADRILSGRGTEDELAGTLADAAAAMRVMAVGISYGPEWILEDRHQLAHPVTRRPQALLDTARELEEGSALAQAGTLN